MLLQCYSVHHIVLTYKNAKSVLLEEIWDQVYFITPILAYQQRKILARSHLPFMILDFRIARSWILQSSDNAKV